MDDTAVFNILIVDDNAAYRQSLSQLLGMNFPSMVVGSARTSGEAWRQLGEIRSGLVFVDVKLRDENGLDLTRDIRRSHAGVIVAVLTGYNILEFRQAAYRNGASYFIPKDLAKSTDIVNLVDSLHSGQPLQWSLGPEYINPSPQLGLLPE